MSYVKGLFCKECGREFPAEPINVCDFCFGPLEVTYDYDAIADVVSRERIESGPRSMWRYHDFLPAEAENAIDINAGYTPLIKANNLARSLGLDELYLKNDAVNPSFSFKDRVVAVASTKAREFGFDTLACASTGNLAGSVAAHAARAGMRAFVFIPADLERGKILGAAVYGPTLVAVDGSYDDVNRLCSELSDNYNWAFVNINMRPYYAEGSKSLGFEVAEQLGWRAPDNCIVPGASGSLFTKIWKGLNEFSSIGLIGEVNTQMFICQAEGCAPIVTAHEAGDFAIRPVKPNTIAKSLAIGNPADGYFRAEGTGGDRRLGVRGAGGGGRGGHQGPGGDGGHLHGAGRRCGNRVAQKAGPVGADQAVGDHRRLHHRQRLQDAGGGGGHGKARAHQAHVCLIRRGAEREVVSGSRNTQPTMEGAADG